MHTTAARLVAGASRDLKSYDSAPQKTTTVRRGPRKRRRLYRGGRETTWPTETLVGIVAKTERLRYDKVDRGLGSPEPCAPRNLTRSDYEYYLNLRMGKGDPCWLESVPDRLDS